MASVGSLPDATRREPRKASLAAKIAALSRPATYPEPVGTVEAIETHFAWVFLTGERAYKLKKPLMLKGADLRSLEARECNCHQELRVNGRLSPEVYLRVAPLAWADGELGVDATGAVEDWLVVMRQLPRERMLDRRLSAGHLEREDVERVVARLIHFYRTLPAERLDGAGYLQQVRARLDEATHELARPEFGLPSTVIAPLGRLLEAAFAHNTVLLAKRAESGRVVEAHGDLRAEHIWLGPPVQIIDALEFDRRLRILDTAEEIAMLVVDVTQLGFPDAAGAIQDAYQDMMPDPLAAGLFAFYAALRAATRAKVAIWHLDDADHYPDGGPWQERARRFADLAGRFAADATAN